MASTVVTDTKDHTLTVTFDRYTKRNSISKKMISDIEQAIDGSISDDIHAVIFRGSNGFFSAGADIDELTGSSEDRSFDEEMSRVIDKIRGMRLVSIAAVEGGCIGAALDLACACDIRIGGSGAYFAVPAVDLGLLYNPRAVARLFAMLPSTTRRLFLFGERLSADAASAAGLLDLVVPDDEVCAAAKKFATCVASSPAASKGAKMLTSLADGSFDADYWQEEYMKIMDTPERREAISKRKKHSFIREGKTE